MFDTMGNGVGPTPNGATIGGGLVAYPMEVYESPVLDLTVPNLGIEVVPAKPNHIPYAITSQWIILGASGTQTSPAQFTAGSNPAHSNLASGSVPSNSDVNGANVPSLSSGGASPFAAQRIPNAPCFLDVTVPAAGTGGFMLMARMTFTIFWMSVE